MSKGSARRPMRVGSDIMADNWQNIFNPGDKRESRLASGEVICTKKTYEEARDYALDYLPEGVQATIVKVRG